ncbi:glucose-1-phosphate thymidylyltransferase RfbA [Cerasicoccus fimbriatus]|uniref:glucose-1-phosphate thymidylyltransferase RfbA n=1 Tax=Cerasicoccus fimbriatus TaxID=3014554 RepID=UPI0022B52A2E|nr:glucose-1-phosphate thymidylyltransferase RfbA [Cerasicoccus sp. TK19100]
MSKNRKGIVLAGGSGTRLYPLTISVSKQLMPVYDKPMIYYPLSVLMLAGIREIMIITTPHDQAAFRALLGDGSQYGLKLEYAIQDAPRGLAEAFIIAEDFLAGGPSALILGDNLFYGHSLPENLRRANARESGGTVFGYEVSNPSEYGVVEFDAEGNVVSIEEKPTEPKSNFAIPGIYFFDERASGFARAQKPSKRGELEITDLISRYQEEGELKVEVMGRGVAWLDTGNPDALLEAAQYVKVIQSRQGLQISCLEEIAFRAGWINREQLNEAGEALAKTPYGKYLLSVAKKASLKGPAVSA